MSSPLCILLVDDSEFFLTLERQFLRNTPAKVITASNAEQALQLARDYRPNIVFLDIDMPGMDGIACCQLMKNDVQVARIPIILIGDKTHPEQKEAARSAPCDAFIEKPLNRREFLHSGHSFLPGIERREPRKTFRLSVLFVCNDSEQMGQCIDISSGGMFLTTLPTGNKGDLLELKFRLPGQGEGQVTIGGRIAWVNIPGQEIKPDYPPGYGVEFIDIPETVGVALRRFFSS